MKCMRIHAYWQRATDVDVIRLLCNFDDKNNAHDDEFRGILKSYFSLLHEEQRVLERRSYR